MNKEILVVFNPMAGSKSDVDVKKLILDILKKEKLEHDFFETIKTGKQPLEQFANGNYEKIIVSGGDGTVAEVVAFLIENKLKAALVIIPQGSANILARSLKISLDPKKSPH